MTVRTATLEAELVIIPGIANVSGRTVIGIMPTDIDPLWDEMRVVAGGRIISRAFDPGQPIVTGAPIPYVTEDGIPYVTEDDVPYVTEVIL